VFRSESSNIADMIKVEWCETNSIVLVHVFGAQANSDFLEASDGLSRTIHAHRASRILFDWSKLQSWPMTKAKSTSLAPWVNLAAQISRAVIVHERCWNRQAAWVAAIMRSSDTEVRSWHCGDRDQAIAWLGAASEAKLNERSPRQ
jgi:hypothetical protein